MFYFVFPVCADWAGLYMYEVLFPVQQKSLANSKGAQLLCQPIMYWHWSEIDQTKPLSAKLIDSNFKFVVLAPYVPSKSLCFLGWVVIQNGVTNFNNFNFVTNFFLVNK